MPCLPAPSAPPGPDWLPCLKPDQHWPTCLSLGYSSSHSGSRELKPDSQKRFSRVPLTLVACRKLGRGL